MKEKFYKRTHQNKASNTKKLKNKKLKTKQKKTEIFVTKNRLVQAGWQKRVYHHNYND